MDFIARQKLFFVATAMKDGHINLSPKGLSSLRVLNENRVIWLNFTGSGNETAAHLQRDSRMTIMFCAFEGAPMILRLYGTSKAYHQESDFWKEHMALFPENAGARQLIDMKVDLVQTSCGFGVPLMEYKKQRQELVNWSKNKTEQELREYQIKKNAISLDGYETEINNPDFSEGNARVS